MFSVVSLSELVFAQTSLRVFTKHPVLLDFHIPSDPQGARYSTEVGMGFSEKIAAGIHLENDKVNQVLKNENDEVLYRGYLEVKRIGGFQRKGESGFYGDPN